MKNITVIVFSFIFTFYTCTTGIRNEDVTIKVKKLILGKWVLSNDDSFILEISKDTMTYYYDGRVEFKNPIVFSFKDSISYYNKGNNIFDFMKNGRLFSKVEIKEYDMKTNDTIANTIIYLDEKGMDLKARNRNVSFNKIK